MPTSEQELEELEKSNDVLRSKIAEARSAHEQLRTEAEADTRAVLLKQEQARLQTELDAELAAGEVTATVADAVATKADEPAETAYAKMMREAEERNVAAQAAADEAAGKKTKNGNGNGQQTPPPTPPVNNGNGGQ